MSSSPVTPDTLMPEIVAQLNISSAWAEQAKELSALGEHTEELCVHYRAMAICLFVSDDDVEVFFHWLLHSPIARRSYLERERAAGGEATKYERASFVDPLLDAIAARQWKLASSLGSLASQSWMEGKEYEDDFCYADFLRRMVNQQMEGMDDLFVRWRAVLDGARDARLSVASALVAAKADDVKVALEALIRRREAKARKMADPVEGSALADELPFFPNRWICVEGLALLALAERQGAAVGDDVETCPRSLRDGKYGPFKPEGYPFQGLG